MIESAQAMKNCDTKIVKKYFKLLEDNKLEPRLMAGMQTNKLDFGRLRLM